jgi:hypothetical protein
MPSSSTIFRWLLDEDIKDFWEQYEKARNIQAENMFEELSIVGDSAEPKSIAELATLGVNVMPCTKGADSVNLGIKQRSGTPYLIHINQQKPEGRIRELRVEA